MTGRQALSERLGVETRELHRAAERTHAMGALLKGELSRERYVLMLRNLHAVYASLEASLRRAGQADPLAAWLDDEALARARPIAVDLVHLHGAGWPEEVALLPEAEAYADAVERPRPGDAAELVAHAWVRYMGDVSGGQILARLVERQYGLTPGGGADSYAFPDLGDLEAFKSEFRARLDALPEADAERMVEAARAGFRLSIALLEAVVQA